MDRHFGGCPLASDGLREVSEPKGGRHRGEGNIPSKGNAVGFGGEAPIIAGEANRAQGKIFLNAGGGGDGVRLMEG